MHLHVFVEDVEDDRRKEAVAHVRANGDGQPHVEVAVQQPDRDKARRAAAACIASGLALASELEADEEVQALLREYDALNTKEETDAGEQDAGGAA